MLFSSEENPRVLCDCFKLICIYLNEGGKVQICHSCFKTMMQARLRLFFTVIMHHLNDYILYIILLIFYLCKIKIVK